MDGGWLSNGPISTQLHLGKWASISHSVIFAHGRAGHLTKGGKATFRSAIGVNDSVGGRRLKEEATRGAILDVDK